MGERLALSLQHKTTHEMHFTTILTILATSGHVYAQFSLYRYNGILHDYCACDTVQTQGSGQAVEVTSNPTPAAAKTVTTVVNGQTLVLAEATVPSTVYGVNGLPTIVPVIEVVTISVGVAVSANIQLTNGNGGDAAIAATMTQLTTPSNTGVASTAISPSGTAVVSPISTMPFRNSTSLSASSSVSSGCILDSCYAAVRVNPRAC